MKYIDIHSHLDLESFGADQALILERMKQAEVGTITIGTKLSDSIEAVKIAEAHENVWACIGVHPKTDGQVPEFDEVEFEKLVVHPTVVAIGECGLDYFRLEGDIEKIKEVQKKVFRQQIEFAIKHNKALMIHTRDSYADTYEILNQYKGKVRGNLHFFVGNLDWANKFIELGFTVSFTGVITFARDYDVVVKSVPLDKIHAETDAPFVAPVPYRGKRNEPSYVIEVVKKIAELRGEEFETVRLQLLENAKRVFGV
jgi:TatD DNase family protein